MKLIAINGEGFVGWRFLTFDLLYDLLFPISADKESDQTQASSTRRGDIATKLSGGPEFDEEAAIRSLRQLDPEIITFIHNRYYPAVYRYARFRLSDLTTAEDVASDVFLRLIEAVHAGKGPRKTLRGWLMGTASNLVNEFYRRQYNRPSVSLSDEHRADLPEPGARIEAGEKARAVRLALANLTPDQQHVLALRFGAEFSLEETAKSMGKKTNAVKQLQFRAISALRRHLGETSL